MALEKRLFIGSYLIFWRFWLFYGNFVKYIKFLKKIIYLYSYHVIIFRR